MSYNTLRYGTVQPARSTRAKYAAAPAIAALAWIDPNPGSRPASPRDPLRVEPRRVLRAGATTTRSTRRQLLAAVTSAALAAWVVIPLLVLARNHDALFFGLVPSAALVLYLGVAAVLRVALLATLGRWWQWAAISSVGYGLVLGIDLLVMHLI